MSEYVRSKVVYLATSDVEPLWDEEFGRWCDEEHRPALLRVPGYLVAQRYVALDGPPKHLTLYEIDSIDAYRSEAHDRAVDTPWRARIRPHVQTRLGFYSQTYPENDVFHGAAWNDGATPAKAILVIRLDIAPERDEELEEWYSQEHLPALCGVPGVIGGRIFKAIEGGPKHMTIFHLAYPEAQASDAWRQAASTPWTMRMRRLVPERWRVVYQPVD